MKKNIFFSSFLMLAFSITAVAQSSSTTSEVHALAEISAVSAMADPFSMKSQQGLVYEVQIMALRKALPQSNAFLGNLEHVHAYEHEGLTKYTWGRTRLSEEAARLQREMHRNGFKDAFVVAYYNGKRISFEEAAALQKE